MKIFKIIGYMFLIIMGGSVLAFEIAIGVEIMVQIIMLVVNYGGKIFDPFPMKWAFVIGGVVSIFIIIVTVIRKISKYKKEREQERKKSVSSYIEAVIGKIFKTISYIIIIILGGLILAAVIIMLMDKYGALHILIMIGTIVVGSGVLIVIRKISKQKQQKIKEREQSRKNIEEIKRVAGEHRQEQQKYRNQMISYGDNALSFFESIPKHLSNAEKYLEQAESDFHDGAFAPFWDSIENTVTALARYDECNRSINDKLSNYNDLIKEYEVKRLNLSLMINDKLSGLIEKYENTPIPKFPISRQSIDKLNIGTAISKQMQAIVRKAHCNPHFAMIYQQYKTNQILVKGFTNLTHALDNMTLEITKSINNLSSSVDTMTSGLEAIHSRIGNIHEELSGEARERTAREEKTLDMLDDIRRGIKPLL